MISKRRDRTLPVSRCVRSDLTAMVDWRAAMVDWVSKQDILPKCRWHPKSRDRTGHYESRSPDHTETDALHRNWLRWSNPQGSRFRSQKCAETGHPLGQYQE